MQEKPYALLISGDEARFARDSLIFQDYLVGEAGFDAKKIRTMFCTYGGTDYILEETESFFNWLKKENPKADVLLFYSGHGGMGGFWPNKSTLLYEEWGKLIDNRGRIGAALFSSTTAVIQGA